MSSIVVKGSQKWDVYDGTQSATVEEMADVFFIGDGFDWLKNKYYKNLGKLSRILEFTDQDLTPVRLSIANSLNFSSELMDKNFYLEGDMIEFLPFDIPYTVGEKLPVGIFNFTAEEYNSGKGTLPYGISIVNTVCPNRWANEQYESGRFDCSTLIGPVRQYQSVSILGDQIIRGDLYDFFDMFEMSLQNNVYVSWGPYSQNQDTDLSPLIYDFVEMNLNAKGQSKECEQNGFECGFLWGLTRWKNVDIFDFKPENDMDTSMIIIDRGMRGQMSTIRDGQWAATCGPFEDYNRNGYHCQQGVFIGPGTNLNGVDCSDLVLDAIPEGMTGRCGCAGGIPECEMRSCPKPHNLPVSIHPTSNVPFITSCVDGVIFHPNMDHRNIDISSTSVFGIDARGQDWSSYVMKHISGRMEHCPDSLPEGYHCINKYIVGPYADLFDADFHHEYMHHIPPQDMYHVSGYLFSCPLTVPEGIRCNFIPNLAKYQFVGEGISVDGDLEHIIVEEESPELVRRRRLVSASRRLDIQGRHPISFKNARMMGTSCPSLLPDLHICYHNPYKNIKYVIGPDMDVSNFDLEGADLRGVDLRRLKGSLRNRKACPKYLPNKWVCLGSSEDSKHTLYGPNSHYSRLNLDYFIVSDDATWSLENTTADDIFGVFRDANEEPKCPPDNMLPKYTTCIDGEVFGRGSSMNNIRNEASNTTKQDLDGMTLTLFDFKRQRRKYNLVRKCDTTHKTYFKTCSAQIKSEFGEEQGDEDIDENEYDGSRIGYERRLKTILPKIKEKFSRHTQYDKSVLTPINKGLFYESEINTDTIRSWLNKK